MGIVEVVVHILIPAITFLTADVANDIHIAVKPVEVIDDTPGSHVYFGRLSSLKLLYFTFFHKLNLKQHHYATLHFLKL